MLISHHSWSATSFSRSSQPRAGRPPTHSVPSNLLRAIPSHRTWRPCCGLTLTLTLTSVLNVVKSPSKLSHPRQHVYAGRVGVITSYLSLAFAYAHAWTDPYLPEGLIIGLSVVGVLQLMFTTGGWLYIRQALCVRQIADALRPHDAAAREAAVREVNRWTEPTPSLLLVFKLHKPPNPNPNPNPNRSPSPNPNPNQEGRRVAQPRLRRPASPPPYPSPHPSPHHPTPSLTLALTTLPLASS